MKISAESCGYCGACVAVCPQKILELWDMRIIAHEGCDNCSFCSLVCPLGAIKEGNE